MNNQILQDLAIHELLRACKTQVLVRLLAHGTRRERDSHPHSYIYTFYDMQAEWCRHDICSSYTARLPWPLWDGKAISLHHLIIVRSHTAVGATTAIIRWAPLLVSSGIFAHEAIIALYACMCICIHGAAVASEWEMARVRERNVYAYMGVCVYVWVCECAMVGLWM